MSVSDPPHLESIWYHHSEPSDVPYSPNQFLGWDFFCRFLQQDGSSLPAKMRLLWTIYNIIKGFLFALIFFVQPSDTHFTLYNLCHKKEKREWKRQQWGQHVIINRRQLNSNLFYGPPHYLHSNRKKVSLENTGRQPDLSGNFMRIPQRRFENLTKKTI